MKPTFYTSNPERFGTNLSGSVPSFRRGARSGEEPPAVDAAAQVYRQYQRSARTDRRGRRLRACGCGWSCCESRAHQVRARGPRSCASWLHPHARARLFFDQVLHRCAEDCLPTHVGQAQEGVLRVLESVGDSMHRSLSLLREHNVAWCSMSEVSCLGIVKCLLFQECGHFRRPVRSARADAPVRYFVRVSRFASTTACPRRARGSFRFDGGCSVGVEPRARQVVAAVE